MPRLPGLRLFAAGLLVGAVAGCSASPGPAVTTRVSDALDEPATDYALSADRALGGTAFEEVDPAAVADTIIEVCTGLGMGAIPSYMDGFVADAPGGDREIMAEVLVRGVLQVCPDRASVDVTSIYLEPITRVAADAGVGTAFDRDRVIRAAPLSCSIFGGGGTAEDALMAIVADLFDVHLDGVVGVEDAITPGQGVVAGAVLSTSTALLCPERLGDVTALVESL